MLSRLIRTNLNRFGSNNVARMSNIPSNAAPKANDAAVPINHVYHEMLHRGRKANKLALGDLRKLIQMCNTPENVKYAVLGVELFQRKGQDYSEEVAVHFINACIRSQSPRAAGELFAKYDHRIGSWATPKSLHTLIENLAHQDEIELMTNVVDVTSRKGVISSVESMELVLSTISKSAVATQPALQAKAYSAAKRSQTPEEYTNLLTKFPIITEVEASTDNSTVPN